MNGQTLGVAGLSVPTLLIFIRLSAFFVTSPFPGPLAPPPLRLAISAGISWAFAGTVPTGVPDPLWAAVVSEVLLGLSMGYLINLIVHAFAYAGEAVSQQMGLRMPGFVNPLDPNLSLLGSAFVMLALGFFAMGPGPSRLAMFLHRMLEIVPPGTIFVPTTTGAIVVQAGSELFAGALEVGAPLITAVFAAQLVLAILARSVPTLNLFIEGPALTTSTGIIGIIASINTFSPLIDRLVLRRLEQIAIWLSS